MTTSTSTPLNQMLLVDSSSIIHTEAFREVIEQHLEYFKNAKLIEKIEVPPERANEFSGNFYGLCRVLFGDAEAESFWIYMRASGYFSPTEYSENHFVIYKVSPNAILTLKNQFTMTHRSS